MGVAKKEKPGTEKVLVGTRLIWSNRMSVIKGNVEYEMWHTAWDYTELSLTLTRDPVIRINCCSDDTSQVLRGEAPPSLSLETQSSKSTAVQNTLHTPSTKDSSDIELFVTSLESICHS